MSQSPTRAVFLATIALLALSNSVSIVSAHCPLCVAGAAAGIATARYYGLDDAVTGLWVGAFLVSMGLWSDKLVKKYVKKNYVPFQSAAVAGVVVFSTIVTFYLAGFYNGMPTMSDTIFGINRLALGTLIGALLTVGASYLSSAVKRRGIRFPYQTLAVTFGILLVASAFFWYVTGNYVLV